MAVREVITTPNDLLSSKSEFIAASEVKSEKIQNLVSDIYDTLKSGSYGVGMSAIQVGEPLAVSIVMIRPTPNRPELGYFNKEYFNPKIIETFGEKEPMWEGCCSVLDEEKNPVYAKVPRYKKIRVSYLDSEGEEQEDIAEDFLAHVLQHEVDHINGIIFTDLVPEDAIVSQEEYRRRLALEKAENK